jgi:hypothetical protein
MGAYSIFMGPRIHVPAHGISKPSHGKKLSVIPGRVLWIGSSCEFEVEEMGCLNDEMANYQFKILAILSRMIYRKSEIHSRGMAIEEEV